MLRSMFVGVSGLKAHQMRMDVIGNNIANVNTAGYKASRVTFQEMLSQTTRGATAPTANRGGSNPQQVGLGVQLGSIDVKHTQGNTQSTGYITDLAIEGDGFFILAEGEDGLNRLYTRAGIFGLDSGGTEGNLVSLVNGMRVMGYRAENGIIDYTSLKPLYISGSQTIEARATDQVVFGGNLDSRYTEGTGVRRTVQVYDSLGTEHTIVVDLTKTNEDNTWDWKAYWLVPSSAIPVDQAGEITPNARYVVHENELWKVEPGYEYDGSEPPGEVVASFDVDDEVWRVEDEGAEFTFGTPLANGTFLTAASDGSSLVLTAELAVGQAEVGPDDTRDTRIKFGTNGSFLGPKPEEAVISFDPAGAESIRIKLDFTQFTQYADTFTGKFLSQNGHTSGALESFTIDQNGVIVGSFSNGLTQALGQVALAKFANPGGLMRSGSTMFMESTNSGSAQVEPAGAPGFGQIIPSALEMSNVDLSEEFTDMIITQRGFQANSRIITTSDEMLQELVNLKR
ncbi:flagellar hook protein FlgE [Candidatus Darwinibacter acetoxidans]